MTDSPSAMIDRVVLIMSLFEQTHERLTLGQISSSSGLPRSSCHRILQQLVGARWLQRSENEYEIGLRMFEIGSLAARYDRLVQVGRSHLHELADSSHQVAYLAILDQDDVVYLDRAGRGVAYRLPSRIGGRLPAPRTAVGKVLLAYGASVGGDAVSARIRQVGFATEADEAPPGLACVAAPIFEFKNAVAAISVCGPAELVLTRAVTERVISVAAAISRGLVTAGRLPQAG